MRTPIVRLYLTLIVLGVLPSAGFGSLSSDGSRRSPAHRPLPALAPERAARAAQFTFQRSYPSYTVPLDGRRKAWESRPRDWIATNQPESLAGLTAWHSIGPTPTIAIPTTVGNESGRIEAIAVSPADPQLILLGGSAGGIWRSTDGGNTFAPVTDDQADIAVGGIAFARSNPSVVYAAMGNQYEPFFGSGILKSTDAGATWSRISNDTLPTGQAARIEVDPTDPDHVYLAQATLLPSSGFAATGGFCFSVDGGINWTYSLSGDANALLLHPTNPQELYICLWYTYERDRQPGLYRSTDGGRTWSLILGSPYSPGGLNIIQPAISAASPDRVYAIVSGTQAGFQSGSPDSRTMVSTDRGKTWTDNGKGGLLQSNWYGMAYADPIDAATIYAGGAELFKSTDGGISYTSLTPGLYTPGAYVVHVDDHSFAFAPADHNTFYLGTDGGLWKSSNGGATFQNLNRTLSLTMFVGIAVHPIDPFLVFGGTQDNGIQKRRSSTPTWDQLRGGDFGQTVVNPLDPGMIFNTEGAYIDRWVNNGDILDRVFGPATPDGRRLPYPPLTGNGTDATLYLGTWRLWVCSDLGETWLTRSGEFDLTKGNGDVLSAIGVSRSNPNVVYIGSAQGRAMVSTDGGRNWVDITRGLPDRYISSITVDPSNPAGVFLTVSGYRSGHVFRTTDAGAMWVDISSNLPDIPTNAFLIDPLDPSTLYAGTDIGVFRSPSAGRTWYTFNTGMPPAVVTGFGAQASGLIRLSTYGRGMYELATLPPPAPRALRRPRVVPSR